MQRTAIQRLQSAGRFPSLLHTHCRPHLSTRYALNIRNSSGAPKPSFTPKSASPMYYRRLIAGIATGFVGYGAWYFGGAPNTTSGSLSSTTGQDSHKGPVYGPTTTGGLETATEVARKVLVVGADTLYTAAVQGPISKDTDESGRKVVEMLTPEQSTHKLRRNEESYFVNRGKGVVRYDVVQIPSNDPIEDDHDEKIIEMPSNDWMFWGVFDGHSGWTTSAKLRQVLIGFVARELNIAYNAALKDPSLSTPSNESVEAAMKTAFNKLDHEIVHESVEKVLQGNSKLLAAELLAPALSGACALLSFYDCNTKLLRVACTGDSRAVLGRRGDSGKWIATPLSIDQTGGTPSEEARLRREHPGEEHVVRNGRILGGLEPSRAFGDATYKWSRDVSERLRKSYFGRSPNPKLQTPPYVTAEPIVTTTKISPEKGDFVVMATDGLWEMLSNEEVIGLVGQWIEKQSTDTSSGSSWTKMFSLQQRGLPVEQEKKNDAKDGQKQPVRQRQWGVNSGENQRFVVEDKNVATHLVRNALGGKDVEMVSALLSLPAPFSRRYRDDLTVEVIFFGNGEKGGDVTVNKDASATANAQKIKAKL